MEKLKPLGEAVKSISSRTPIGSLLRSREWEVVPLMLRQRAQFSAGVTSARLLQTVQDRLASQFKLELEKLATGKTATFDRSSFIDAVRAIGRDENLTPVKEEDRGTVRDITSIPRLGLIYDMQNAQAAGFARHKLDTSEGALNLFPAYRLGESSADEPRPLIWWERRWFEAGQSVAWMGAVQPGFVALKTSMIWSALSRFGTPWPPFDWGSTRQLDEVGRDEAEALGLIQPNQVLSPGAEGGEDFNRELEASVTGLGPELRDILREHFGKQISVDAQRIRWNPGKAAEHEQRIEAQQQESRNLFRRNEEALGAVGRRISEAEGRGGGVPAARDQTPVGPADASAFRSDHLLALPEDRQYTYRQAAVQTAAVGSGRKPLYHEQFLTGQEARSVAAALRNTLPDRISIRVLGDQVFVWDHGILVKDFTAIARELAGGRGGGLLGYGASQLNQPGSKLVLIEDANGRLVSGFHSPAATAELYGAARARDFSDATGQVFRYRLVNLKA